MPYQKAKTLIISVSGVRGIVDEGLNEDVAARFGRAFGAYLGGGVVAVANDGRASRRMCFEALSRGLSGSGCTVADLGTCPTPTLQLAIPKTGAGGGVCITASHNPPEWNGFKFYTPEGILLDDKAVNEVISLFESCKPELELPPFEKVKIKRVDSAVPHHVRSVIKHLDTGLISKRNFKVAFDPVNGAGSVITEKLLAELGCEIIKINYGLTGAFSRPPEPLPENLAGLRKAVLDSGADIGFAQDPDADRLAIVSEKGECPGEDYTLALAVKSVISKNPGTVVTTLSTSQAIGDVCSKYGCTLLRTKVGERNVVGLMRETGAIVGGEGNGGVIYPAVQYGRDSLAGIGIILQHMAESGLSVSGLLGEIPRYSIIKEKLAAGSIRQLEEIASSAFFSSAELDLTNGLKASWGKSWVHIRPSGTEPVVRVIVEAETPEKARRLRDELMSEISALPA